MNQVGRVRCCLPLVGLLFAEICPDGKAQLRFDPPALEANHFKLSLHGETGSNYVIESSVNLTNWSFLFSGMATDGLVSFLHSPAFNSDSLFYRAHSGVAQVAVPINVQPRADTNATGGTLVTVDDGGDFTFFGSDGTRFSLTFPSNTIPDATLVSMTLVTNVAALPFSRGIIGAVRLEPEDLDIFGAGILEISFPTNIDWRQIVSFTCGNDGSDFYLTPDLVHSNYVTIPLTHFGTFGSCLATTQELAQVVGPAAQSNGTSRTIAKQDAILGSSLICFPERVARAVEVREKLRNLRKDSDKDLAKMLAIEKQKQIMGIPDYASELISEVASNACPFYREQVAPYWPEAANNCALNAVLLQCTLGFEQQLEVLGFVGEKGTCTSIKNQPLCAGFKACLEEIKECCQRVSQGHDRVAELFSVKHHQDLVGLNCLTDDEIQEVLEACTNLTWNGTLKVKEAGSTVERTTFNNGLQENSRSYRATFEGLVIQSTEQSLGPFGKLVSLIFQGSFAGKRVDRRYSENQVNCGTAINLLNSEEDANTASTYFFQFTLAPDGSYVITASPQDIVLGTEETVTERTEGPTDIGCVGFIRKITTSRGTSGLFLGPNLVNSTQNSGSDTNIQGIATSDGLGFIPTKTSFEWELKRKKTQP